MKKFDLPLWADSVFVFTVVGVLFLVCFRFTMPLGLAILCSLLAAASGSTLFYFIYKRHRTKRHYSVAEKEKMAKLAFHLAIIPQKEKLAIVLQALTQKSILEEKPAPILQEQAVLYNEKKYISQFLFEKITADMLAPYVCAETDKIIFIALDYTAEAKKLANSFNLTLLDLPKLYDFLKKYNALPESFVQPPNTKQKFVQKLQQQLSKKVAKGYLFSGCFLLLFSLITIFPLYYIIFGSILLSIAVFLRFFGKSEQ